MSNDWSPPCIPPRQVHRQHTHTARSEASQWHTVVLHSRALAFSLPADLSVHALHSVPLVCPPAGEERNSLGFFQLVQSLFNTEACVQRFSAVPDDSWPLYSSRLNCGGGSNSSRKTPTMGCESPAVPVNLGPICELR